MSVLPKWVPHTHKTTDNVADSLSSGKLDVRVYGAPGYNSSK